MTPAINYLEKQNIPHRILRYEHQASAESYGLEAATKLKLEPSQVLKTLVVCLDNDKLGCVLVPVNHTMNLKAAAKAFGSKKASMAAPQAVERSTGYVLGGVSPVGQKKRLPCAIDDSAKGLDEIYVSAGRRGLEIGLSPLDLARACNASFEALKD